MLNLKESAIFLGLLNLMLNQHDQERWVRPSDAELGWCPHGATEDEGCDEPGCYGGPEGSVGPDDERRKKG